MIKLFPVKFIKLQATLIARFFSPKKLLSVKTLLIPLLIFTLGAGTGYVYFTKTNPSAAKQQATIKDPYIAFLSEIYDKVMENYWDNITDDQLSNIFKLASEKLTGQPQELKTKQKPVTQNKTNPAPGLSVNLQGSSIGDLKLLDENSGKPSSKKEALMEMLKNILKSMDDKQKKEFSVNIAASVLSNLNPFGRSGLYTQKLETQLKNTVSNINPEKDLYKDLGIAKGSTQQQVKEAYEKKADELSKQDTPEAKEKLKEATYAKEVLAQPDRKERYDQKGVEPTLFTKVVQPGILYLQFKKFSPTSYDEFVKSFDPFKDDKNLYGLIFDLRGNVGGAIDAAPYFIGNFIGKNAYAFDFFHKGEYQPFKT
ncbi:DnaJ domain-containing protein, partial [Candidatus Daviesbacteria bacterium]|nr:DnaJ domain-containing protein [Candidatus Daviesbacteria bacterium]